MRAGNLRGVRDHNRGLSHQPTEGTRSRYRNLRRHPDGRKDAAQVNPNRIQSPSFTVTSVTVTQRGAHCMTLFQIPN